MASDLIVHADEPDAWAWLSTLALSGRTAEAVAEVRLMANPGSRGRALASLALTLAKSGQTAESAQLARKALRTLPLMDDGAGDRDNAIPDITQALVADGQVKEALAAFRKIASSRAGAFAVAKEFAETGKLDKLMEAARDREGPWANDVDLAYASKVLASAAHPDEALILARLTKIPGLRVIALAWVARGLRQAGRTEMVSAVAEEALASRPKHCASQGRFRIKRRTTKPCLILRGAWQRLAGPAMLSPCQNRRGTEVQQDCAARLRTGVWGLLISMPLVVFVTRTKNRFPHSPNTGRRVMHLHHRH